MARELVKISGIETGELRDFPTITPPSGWLERDGSVLSKTTYAKLYAVLGDTYNIGGEGVDEFRLPDDRGLFIRGAGINGTLEEAGGDPFTGPNVGDTQNDQMQRITGNWQQVWGLNASQTGALARGSGSNNMPNVGSNQAHIIQFQSASSPNARASSTTGGETRPCNRGVLRCIKY